MPKMKSHASATLIGDVVDSRHSPDRALLHRELTEALSAVNDATDPAQPLRITVGDEFQGAYATVGAAVAAALAVRLALPPTVDARFGIGWGAVAALDDTTQDGPGWWAAREAIVAVKDEQSRAATSSTRTLYRQAMDAEPDGPDPLPLNAALRCRDQMMGSLDDRSSRILRALMNGSTQAAVAESEGISASAVSQRVRADGLAVIVAAHRDLSEIA